MSFPKNVLNYEGDSKLVSFKLIIIISFYSILIYLFKSTIIEFSFYDNQENRFLTNNEVIQSLLPILNTNDANKLGIINITVLIFNYNFYNFLI